MIRKLWRNLIAPNSRLNPDDQRRARLLNSISLALGLFILLTIFLPQLGGFSLIITVFLLSCFIFCMVAYILTRSGWINAGALLLFILLMAGVIAYIALSDDPHFIPNLRGVTPLMVIPTLAAGVVIGPAWSFLVAALGSIGVSFVAFNRSRPGFPDLDNVSQVISQLSIPVALLFIIAGLSWLFESDIQVLLRQLRSKNAELENTNRELERSRAHELRVGKEINKLSGQVSEAFSSQTSGAADQLSMVVEVTATLEELSQTNEQIARAANQVATSARTTLEVAEQGSINIKHSLESTILLSERVQKMADAMNSLFEQARQVDQIIELITEVSEETNLLALNATIEAAGAREYGRRFAAVAGEVQRLANRSRDASEQVRQVINEVQEAVRASAEVSQTGLQEASRIVGGARQAEQTIEEMVDMVQHTTMLAQQISLAIQQQRTASNQVVETMRQISDVSQRVAENSTILLNTLTQLNQAADQLKPVSNVTDN